MTEVERITLGAPNETMTVISPIDTVRDALASAQRRMLEMLSLVADKRKELAALIAERDEARKQHAALSRALDALTTKRTRKSKPKPEAEAQP